MVMVDDASGSGSPAKRMLTMDDVAKESGMSIRWFQGWIAAHPVDASGTPFYIPMGRRKMLEAFDVTRIKNCPRGLQETRWRGASGPRPNIPTDELIHLAIENTVAARPKAKTRQTRVRIPNTKSQARPRPLIA
jgi:hypothetical protein